MLFIHSFVHSINSIECFIAGPLYTLGIKDLSKIRGIWSHGSSIFRERRSIGK